MPDQVFVQVRFSRPTKYGDFQDALYYGLAEYQDIDPQVIEDAKQARVANYITILEANGSNPAPEPTKEELQNSKASLLEQIAIIEDRIAKAK